MPRVEVIGAIQNYLEAGFLTGAVPVQNPIPSLSTVYPYPPKITKQTALYEIQPPGEPGGAVIFMYLSGQQGEVRISSAGQHGGRKARTYHMSLICYFRWVGPQSEDAGLASDQFIDGLTAWIQADRNAGTEAESLGGFGPYVGTGLIFSWGEGDGAELSGPDIRVNSTMPRSFGGQTLQTFSIVDISVVEIIDT